MTIKEESKEIEKYRTFITNNIVVCKCGHSVFLPEKDPVKICTHCRKYVFRDEKTKFKFMLSKTVAVEEG